MKKLLFALALSTLIATPIFANAASYQIDTKGAHASVNFKVSHLGYSFIQGRFNKFSGSFDFDPKNISASKVTVNIDTRSVDSNHAERDKHIKSSDFINASKFSTAVFVSTQVTPKAGDRFTINGNLTLHGMTKKIVMQYSHQKEQK